MCEREKGKGEGGGGGSKACLAGKLLRFKKKKKNWRGELS